MCLIGTFLLVRDLVCPTMGFCPLSYRRVMSLISRHPGGFESCRAEINQILVEVSAFLYVLLLSYAPSYFHFSLICLSYFVQNHAHVAECRYCLSESVLDRMFMNDFGGQTGPDDAWRPAVLARIREVAMIPFSCL